ncbi:hypothetical protein [Actinoplanes sp. DH11]|uniref:hypothetical protein n=1 Tax=Actinoplanes sp. DH11 TaxID=2857011 RepID=UPI001E3AB4A2|nr:hypothetical protein [Actinoplanes sp. DH11]
MTDVAPAIGQDPWRGGAAVRADVTADLPADALSLLGSVGLPVEIEGMFYRTGHSFLGRITVDGTGYHHLGLNEQEYAGAYLARSGDGQVRHVGPDGAEEAGRPGFSWRRGVVGLRFRGGRGRHPRARRRLMPASSGGRTGQRCGGCFCYC